MSKGFQSATMRQIYGAVEFWSEGQWLEVVDIASLLAQHIGLNGCLFGVDNHAGYAPLFADRGLPRDCSATLLTRAERFTAHDRRASWALWSELAGVDWEVRADDRHGQGALGPEDGADASDAVIDKWLHDRRQTNIYRASLGVQVIAPCGWCGSTLGTSTDNDCRDGNERCINCGGM